MKLNNLSRLTALLLALMMLPLAAFASSGLSVYDLTGDVLETYNTVSEFTEADYCAVCAEELVDNSITTWPADGYDCLHTQFAKLSASQRYDILAPLAAANNQLYWAYIQAFNTHYYNDQTAYPWLVCFADNCSKYQSWSPAQPGAANHDATCPWHDEEYVETPGVITPPPVEKPKEYAGNPDGAQYTADTAHILSGDEDRAVILQEGSRATLATAATAAGQWQVYTGSEWVDIEGETASTIVVTEAKLNTIFELTGIAQLRYYDETNAIVLASASVTTQEIAGGEYVVEDTEDNEQVNLRTVTRAEEDERTITVKFVYEGSGNPVQENNVGEFVLNTAVDWAVTVPTVEGYTATYTPAADDTSAELANSKLNIHLDAITENLEYEIVYTPAEVGYSVHHYTQNLEDDTYELHATVSHHGLTGQYIAETMDPGESLAIDIAGFRVLPYSTNFKVASDGSTVIEIYYDRNYYLINFDLTGGTGVEPIYARYGTEISVVNPTRAGYSFDGWDSEIPDTMPATNPTFTATWKPAVTSYTVVYWFENADSTDSSVKTNYSVVYVDTVDEAVTEVPVYSDGQPNIETYNISVGTGEDELLEDPKHFTRYNYADMNDAVKASLGGEYTIAGDGSTIVDVYYTRNEYTIRFYYAAMDSDGYVWVNNSSTVGRTLAESVSHWSRPNYTTGGRTVYARELPEFDADFVEDVGSDNFGSHPYPDPDDEDWTLYYYDITAKYNSEISTYWPNLKFDYSRENDPSDETYYGWIQNSWFVHEDTPMYKDSAVSIQTFKGVYSRLDDYIISAAGNDEDLNIQHGKLATYFIAYWRTLVRYYNYNIWYEFLEGDVEDAKQLYDEVRKENDKVYYLDHTVVATSGSGYGGQNAPGYVGYKNVLKDYDGNDNDNANPRIVDFLYDPLEYKLRFMSSSNSVEYLVPYGKKLDEYAVYKPTNTPENYVFAGWYTTQQCIDGTEYKFEGATMPANNIILYAKWLPVNRTVEFYLTEQDMTDEKLAEGYDPQIVPHGTILGEVPEPENGRYYFDGWFYRDEAGVEKAINFSNMPITRDLKVYAKWSSNVLVDYTIHYVRQDNGEPVAESDSGQALAATTDTFEAKTGNELNEDYQTGWFPTVASHSMVFDIEEENVFTFEYVQAAVVPYVVYYVTEEPAKGHDFDTVEINGKDYYMVTQETKEETAAHQSNKKSVVTETYKNVQGYLPDAYQKTLILSVVEKEDGTGYEGNDEANIIVFFYTANPNSTTYKVEHWIENATAEGGWTLYTEEVMPAAIDDLRTAQEIEIPNYVFDEDNTNNVKSGKVVANGGLTLKLYYLEETATINYVVVGPDNCGTVQVGTDASGRTASETVKVVTGTAQGSTPEAAQNYKFVGWFEDAACSIPVDEAWVGNSTDKLTPAKETTALWPTTSTYYAKFELDVADLTITKTVVDAAYTAAPVGDSFTIQVAFTGASVAESYAYTITNGSVVREDGTVTLSNGVATFNGIKHDDVIVIKDVVIGTGYTVSETDKPNYSETVDAYGQERVEAPDEEGTNSKVDVTNQYLTGSLTISKTVTSTSSPDNESFIFHVTGVSGYETYVTIKFDGSTGTKTVTLTNLELGTYTVTETGWSYRYELSSDTPQSVTLNQNSLTGEVTFTNSEKGEKWLHDETSVTNTFATN